MTQPTAVLIASKKDRVTREHLAEIPTPAPRGKYHRPVPHLEVVRTLDATLQEAGIRITSESLATGRTDRSRLFGTFLVEPMTPDHPLVSAQRPDGKQAMALVSGNDGQVSLRLGAGTHVLTCTNLMLSARFLCMNKRHTLHLSLEKELREGIERWQAEQLDLVALTDRAKQTPIADDDARLEIFKVFERGDVLAQRLFPEVVQNYFRPEPTWDDCTPRTRYGLHSAFTRALRGASDPIKFASTTKLARLLRPEWPDTN